MRRMYLWNFVAYFFEMKLLTTRSMKRHYPTMGFFNYPVPSFGTVPISCKIKSGFIKRNRIAWLSMIIGVDPLSVNKPFPALS